MQASVEAGRGVGLPRVGESRGDEQPGVCVLKKRPWVLWKSRKCS